MSLPVAWVDRIFLKLTHNYGLEFLNRYKGQDMNDIKSDWCDQLQGYEKSPDSIVFALDNLPEKPPTAQVFKALCRQAPVREVPALPLPKVNPEIAAKVFEAIKASTPVTSSFDPRAWAKSILAHPQGRTPTVIDMARRAIGETA
jgi:hypothetical protein